LEGRDGDAKELENPLAADGECQQQNRGNETRQPRHFDPLLRRVVGSHRQKGGHRRDRINDHKQRAGGQQNVSDQIELAGVHTEHGARMASRIP
jgi:hypothetical protein